MAKPLVLAAALLLSASAALAEGGFKAMSFGEGGGYTQPDAATQQFLDGGAQNPPPAASAAASAPKPAASAPTAGAASPASALPAPPAASAPQASSKIFAPAPRPAAPSVGGPSRRESLWNGVVRPLAVSPGITSDDPDEARAAGDGDYAARVLGRAEAPRGPRVTGPGAATPAAPGANFIGGSVVAATAGRPGQGRLFVSFEIDPREAGTLRDAVAGLGAAAGFAADARFEPGAGMDGIERISGWIPAARLGDALRRPGVRSVRVDEALPAPAATAFSRFLIGLRVFDPSRAQAEVEADLRDLSALDGFRATRVVGLETAPDGSAVAVVEGRLALARLPQVMNRTDVVRVEALLPEPAKAAASPAPAGGLPGFARFAYRHGLWLILVTLLAALPSLRSVAVRVAELFNPYR